MKYMRHSLVGTLNQVSSCMPLSPCFIVGIGIATLSSRQTPLVFEYDGVISSNEGESGGEAEWDEDEELTPGPTRIKPHARCSSANTTAHVT